MLGRGTRLWTALLVVAGCSSGDRPAEGVDPGAAPRPEAQKQAAESTPSDGARPASKAEGAPAGAAAEDRGPELGEVTEGLFITAKALRAELDAGAALTLVDVRSESRYEAYRIQNALHLSPVQLGHAAPTRVGRAVVITDGHGADGVAERVAALRDDGLDLVVLHGGMQAWCRLGADTTLPCRGADRMTAAELARTRGAPDRLTVVALAADAPERSALQEQAGELLPDAEVVVFDSPAALAREVQRAQRRTDARQVAVIDGDGGGYDPLRDALREAVDAHLFFVDGGLGGVEHFEASQRAMASRRTIVSQGTRSSGTGSQRPAVVRAPKGCGCH